jgi:predicted P-loop ATPase
MAKPSTSTTPFLKASDYIDGFIKLGYKFRLNLCSDLIEVNGKPITDELAKKIRVQMMDLGFRDARIVEDVYTAHAYDNSYHPVKDYLTHLPAYDGSPYILTLSQCFNNSDGLFYTWLRRWMIGAIAKVIGGEQNPMLILDGPQGIGKSLFARWLCSGIPYFFIEGNIDTDGKDSYIRLASKWIWEVGEVGATLRRSDREALKNFLTMGEVTVRKSYGKHDMVKPAMASFIGTVNNEGGILDDPTGNRRFLICHLENIDWGTYTQMPINMIWSEAYSAYLMGEQWTLTNDEKILAEENNQKYEVEDPIEIVLKDNFDINPARIDWWVSTATITAILQDKGIKFTSPKALQMALAATLKKMGLNKKRVNQRGMDISGYIGLEVSFPGPKIP